MTEYEKTYLVAALPKGLVGSKHDDISDLYVPAPEEHPSLRLRKRKTGLELTKKEPVTGTDSTIQKEQTIILDQDEYEAIATIPGKWLKKRRYYLPVGELTAEIDIYGGPLSGLVFVDFEFKAEKQLRDFVQPDFCLVDVSQEKWAAAGMLAGKSYEDVEPELKKNQYQRLDVADLLRDFA